MSNEASSASCSQHVFRGRREMMLVQGRAASTASSVAIVGPSPGRRQQGDVHRMSGAIHVIVTLQQRQSSQEIVAVGAQETHLVPHTIHISVYPAEANMSRLDV